MTSKAVPTPEVKPRLRGWIHQIAFWVSLATGATLFALAASTVSTTAALATAIYAVTVLGVFGVSAAYHRRNWLLERSRIWMKRLDHSMIFVFIAGTYTPFALLALSGTSRIAILAVVWGGALAGVTLKLAWPTAPRWLGVPIYLALGWAGVFVLPELLAASGVAAIALIALGGVIYSLGAVVYALKRPNPWPRTFGFHELFHACTAVAAICHYVAVWLTMYATLGV